MQVKTSLIGLLVVCGIGVCSIGTAAAQPVGPPAGYDIDSEFTGNGLKATHTDKGDSDLEGKYGSARGPKIILKTSYDSIQIRKTT